MYGILLSAILMFLRFLSRDMVQPRKREQGGMRRVQSRFRARGRRSCLGLQATF